MSLEAKRIRALPRRVLPLARYESGEVDLTPEFVSPGGLQVLRPIQSQALLEMWACQGLIGPIGVGLGKTLILFLSPICLASKKPLMIVPASCHDQILSMYAEALPHWNLPPLDIWTYSMLQSRRGEEILRSKAPDAIICDEVHYLRNPKSGRAGRVLRYLHDYPDTQFVGVSGTLITTSVKDYGHIVEGSLGECTTPPHGSVRGRLDSISRELPPSDEPTVSPWVFPRALHGLTRCGRIVGQGSQILTSHHQAQKAGLVFRGYISTHLVPETTSRWRLL